MTKYKTIYADPPWQIKAGRPIGGYHLEDGKQIWKRFKKDNYEYKFLCTERHCYYVASLRRFFYQ
jgi:hypothetical protein